jgi:hypothetical protein
MDDFEIPVDEDYQDAPEEMIFEDDVFDDIDSVVIEDDFDYEEAVDLLYDAIYGDE